MPRCFTLMQYVLEPDLDSDRYALTDAKDGDRPRQEIPEKRERAVRRPLGLSEVQTVP